MAEADVHRKLIWNQSVQYQVSASSFFQLSRKHLYPGSSLAVELEAVSKSYYATRWRALFISDEFGNSTTKLP